jgi:hypothetical protein
MASGRSFRRSLVLALLLAAVAIGIAVLTTPHPAGESPLPSNGTLDRPSLDAGRPDTGRVSEPVARSDEPDITSVSLLHQHLPRAVSVMPSPAPPRAR